MDPKDTNKTSDDTPTSLNADEIASLNTALKEMNEEIRRSREKEYTTPKPAEPMTPAVIDDVVGSIDPTDPDSIKQALKATAETVEKRMIKKYEVDQERRFYETKVEAEFPEMRDKNNPLTVATVEELRRRIAKDRKYLENTPSAYYDAACVAWNQINRKPGNTPPTDPRDVEFRDAYVPTGTSISATADHNPYEKDKQAYLAAKFSVPVDVFKTIHYIQDRKKAWVLDKK